MSFGECDYRNAFLIFSFFKTFKLGVRLRDSSVCVVDHPLFHATHCPMYGSFRRRKKSRSMLRDLGSIWPCRYGSFAMIRYE